MMLIRKVIIYALCFLAPMSGASAASAELSKLIFVCNGAMPFYDKNGKNINSEGDDILLTFTIDRQSNTISASLPMLGQITAPLVVSEVDYHGEITSRAIIGDIAISSISFNINRYTGNGAVFYGNDKSESARLGFSGQCTVGTQMF